MSVFWSLEPRYANRSLQGDRARLEHPPMRPESPESSGQPPRALVSASFMAALGFVISRKLIRSA